MKPMIYDFDVITDGPAPKRRPPEPADRAPQADAEEQRRTSPAEHQEREKIRAAE